MKEWRWCDGLSRVFTYASVMFYSYGDIYRVWRTGWVGWGEVEVELELEVLVWGLCRRYIHGEPSAFVGYLYIGSFSLISCREPKIASSCCLFFLLSFVSTPFAVLGLRSTAASVSSRISYHLYSPLTASSAFLRSNPGFHTR